MNSLSLDSEYRIKVNSINNLFHSATVYSSGIRTRSCNICNSSFIQSTRFDRFCNNCRSSDELYKFAEWAN